MRRRTIVIGLIAVVILAVLAIVLIPKLTKLDQESTQTYWPTKAWRTSTPEEQGFDSVKLAEGLQNLQINKIQIDSLLIIRNGNVIVDAYFYPYDHTIPHKLASVTKSFTTTLIGIAIDQGKIQLDQPMVSLFSDRTIANLDEWKKSITIRNLVSNMNGFESGCLMGDEPTLDKMRASSDWVQSSLDRKVVWEPGTNFCYDSPGMHILSAILQESTGMTELDYAREYLFKPLGIRDVYWEPDPQGYTHGWGDLYLKPLDAAKLGYLWLNQGVWDGRQIVPAAWVADSIKPYSYSSSDNYGYGWWVSDDSYYAYGRGGQYIKIYPAYKAIVVITASAIDFNQIDPLLKAAFIDPVKPLAPNPSGVAKLQSTVNAVAQAPHAWQVGPLPATSKEVSNKTYLFELNIIEVSSIRLKFNGNKEATLYMNIQGQDVTWPVGLDGKYRVEPDGRALRGYWPDDNTFNLEIFESGLRVYKLHFENDRMILETSVMKLEGKVENP
jgi:CubicO group peptidase (beta-lactamase class C family)